MPAADHEPQHLSAALLSRPLVGSAVLNWLAIALAGSALAVAVVAMRRSESNSARRDRHSETQTTGPQHSAAEVAGASVTAGSPALPAAGDHGSARTALLVGRIAALEMRMTALESHSQPPADTPGADEAEREAPAMPSPKFARIRAPAGLTVQQDEQGNLSIFNTDPTLSGQTLVIQGVDEAGNEVPLTITVPPP